jgi:predicted small integral membrane protein
MTTASSIKTTRARIRPRIRQRTATALFLLAAYLIVVYRILPERLPAFFHGLVGFVLALLAGLTLVFAIREFARGYNRARLPIVGKIRTSFLLGAIVFILVLAWWFSPWSPISFTAPAGPAA